MDSVKEVEEAVERKKIVHEGKRNNAETQLYW